MAPGSVYLSTPKIHPKTHPNLTSPCPPKKPLGGKFWGAARSWAKAPYRFFFKKNTKLLVCYLNLFWGGFWGGGVLRVLLFGREGSLQKKILNIWIMKEKFNYKCKCSFSLNSFKETHLLWFRFLWHMCQAQKLPSDELPTSTGSRCCGHCAPLLASVRCVMNFNSLTFIALGWNWKWFLPKNNKNTNKIQGNQPSIYQSTRHPLSWMHGTGRDCTYRNL